MNENLQNSTTEQLYRRVAAYAAREGLRMAPHPLPVLNVGILYTDHPTEVSHEIYAPLFCTVLGGEKKVDFNGERYAFSAGNGMVLSTDLPATAQISRASRQDPYVTIAVLIDRALLRSLAREMELPEQIHREDGGDTSRHLAHAVIGMAPNDRIMALMNRVMDLLESDRPDDPEEAARLSRELHSLLLRDPANTVLRRMACEGSETGRVADTMGYLRHNMDRHIPVEELARMAAMSPTVYHRRFKALTGTTPLQYHKRIRLLEARRLIASGETGVTQAAFSTGYESASQFSREYSRMFGHPPREDRGGQ